MNYPCPSALAYSSVYRVHDKDRFVVNACYAFLFSNPGKKGAALAFPSKYVCIKQDPEKWENSHKHIVKYWADFIDHLGKPYSFTTSRKPLEDVAIARPESDNFFGNVSLKFTVADIAFFVFPDPEKVSTTTCFALATLARYITEFPTIVYAMYHVHQQYPHLTYSQAYLFANVVEQLKMNNHTCFNPNIYKINEETFKTWSLEQKIADLGKGQKPWSDSTRKVWITDALTPTEGSNTFKKDMKGKHEHIMINSQSFHVSNEVVNMLEHFNSIAPKKKRKYTRNPKVMKEKNCDLKSFFNEDAYV